MTDTGMRCVLLAALAAGSVHATAAVAAGKDSLAFEQVFRADDRGPQHFRGTFLAPGAHHSVEVWRDAGRRLKRVTDESVETHVSREGAGPEYRMTVLDLKRRIATTIDRSNLLRIGNFTEWFDLAHGLRHPKGEYHLARAAAPAGAPQPVQRCTWYRLEQQGGAATICWSADSQLPMLIVSDQGHIVWRVAAVDRRPIREQVFAIDDRGFVRNNANEDIERD